MLGPPTPESDMFEIDDDEDIEEEEEEEAQGEIRSCFLIFAQCVRYK
jgi:hypothetical protein